MSAVWVNILSYLQLLKKKDNKISLHCQRVDLWSFQVILSGSVLALSPLCLIWHEWHLSLFFSSLILSSVLGSEFLAASSSHPLWCLACWSRSTKSVCLKSSVQHILRSPASCSLSSTLIKFNNSEGFSVLLQKSRWSYKSVIIVG